jgi:hypothetical protein
VNYKVKIHAKEAKIRVAEPDNLKTVPVPTFYLNTVPVPVHIHAYIYTYTYTYMCISL